MSGGDGVDLGAVHQATMAISTDLRAFRAEVKAEFGDVRAEIGDLRQTVADYHHAVIGHGVLIGELDERVGRLGQQRREPPPEAA